MAIVVSWLTAAIFLYFVGRVDSSTTTAIFLPAVLLAVVGFVDDRIGLSPWTRLAVHIGAAAWFVVTAGGQVSTGIGIVDSSPVFSVSLTVIALVWLINLYNFMDGIDGLAAGESVFMGLAISVFCWQFGGYGTAMLSLALAAASAGFLVWNWPPARIFMGDTGSAWVGFVLGALALSGSAETGVSIWPWVILLGIFLVDSSITLLRRLVSGQKWYEAHRSHAYQILSRRWGGHRSVTVVVAVVNTCWLLPISVIAIYLPDKASLLTLLALAPLVVVVIGLGAGRLETTTGADGVVD